MITRAYIGTMPAPHPGGRVPTIAELSAVRGDALRAVASHDGAIWYVRDSAGCVVARGLTEPDALRYAADALGVTE